jgi:hypothetical protein
MGGDAQAHHTDARVADLRDAIGSLDRSAALTEMTAMSARLRRFIANWDVGEDSVSTS